MTSIDVRNIAVSADRRCVRTLVALSDDPAALAGEPLPSLPRSSLDLDPSLGDMLPRDKSGALRDGLCAWMCAQHGVV